MVVLAPDPARVGQHPQHVGRGDVRRGEQAGIALGGAVARSQRSVVEGRRIVERRRGDVGQDLTIATEDAQRAAVR